MGAAVGGPAAAGMGLAHGSTSGLLYGALKEAGMDDPWALGVTALVTVSPVAAQKLWPKLVEKFKSGSTFNDAIKAVEETKGRRLPSDEPPSATSRGVSKEIEEGVPPNNSPQLAPEERLKAPANFLQSDFELAEEIRDHLSPFEIEAQRPTEAHALNSRQVLTPIEPVLNEITPNRVNNPNMLGRMAERTVQEVDKSIYAQTQRDWKVAKDLASETEHVRPDLIESLKTMIEEKGAPVRGGEAKTASFAEDLYDKLIRRKKIGTKRYKTISNPISNKELISAIQNARVGYDYRFTGGVQGHKVNEFINMVEKELMTSASEAERRALLNARNSTAQWATVFKNPSVLPFRRNGIVRPQSLYASSLRPDVFHILSPILEQTPRGRVLTNLLKRNIVEKTLEPYLLRPQAINPMQFERDMGKLEGILSAPQAQRIVQEIESHQHQALNPPIAPKPNKTFANITEKEIPSKLKTIEGLRQLKRELASVPKGSQLYEKVAKTQGIDLLFGGQLDISARSERITKMLNDRNGRFYLKETLGEKNVAALEELSKKNQLEKRLKQIETSPELYNIATDPDAYIKGGALIADIIRGRPVAAVKKIYGLYKKFKNKSNPSLPSQTSAPSEYAIE